VTFRALLLGLFGAAGICGFTYFNDVIMRQTRLVGNNMPIPVYGGLILFLLLINPLLSSIRNKLALSGKELAVILTLTLAACCIPGTRLMRSFTLSVMLPHHYARTEPGWKEQGLIKMVPDRMLADVSKDEGRALDGFVRGLPKRHQGQKHISLFEIPWYAWGRTLSFWVPVILALWIGLIGLSVMIHRQWSDHEQLPYPIAQFASSLLPGRRGTRGDVFFSRLFWIGALAVIAVHLNNYAYEWFPRHLIKIPTMFDFTRLVEQFPRFARGGGLYRTISSPSFFFTGIALAYFIASDASLSLGIGPYVYTYINGLLIGYGISLRAGGLHTPKIEYFITFGAFLGVFLVVVYTGRHYYSNTFRRALLLPVREDMEPQSVWGARVFILGIAVFVANLVVIGLDWQLALLYTSAVVGIFLVMSRVMAETGVFFMSPRLFPGVLLAGILGYKALGPQTLLIMLVLSMVLMMNVNECLMPIMVNSLKLLDVQRVKLGRCAIGCVAAIVVGLAVALPVTLYFQYDRGADLTSGWLSRRVPTSPFSEAIQVQRRLTAQGKLELANSLSGWQRFGQMSPNMSCMIGFAAGLGLVLLCTAGRLRFANWPFHPVMFLVWQSYPGRALAPSFLLGWLIKTAVSKYGGAAGYQSLKPLMFGLIAGDMLGGVVPIIIGFIYYQVTGEIPQSFYITPG